MDGVSVFQSSHAELNREWEMREPHICQGNATGLYSRDKVIEPIVVPYARRHGNTFIFQDDNANPSCACCLRSPAVSQNDDSASEVPRIVSNWTVMGHPWETCPETTSQAIGHQRARWCTPRGRAPDPPSNLWVAHQEHEVSSRIMEALTRYWDFCEINIMTLSKFEVRFKSRDSLTHLSLVINVLFNYHCNAITWKYKSDSKQNVFLSFSNQISPTLCCFLTLVNILYILL